MNNCPTCWENPSRCNCEEKDHTRETTPPFIVRIAEMVESHRKTYWVILENTATRPKNASLLDETGKITPFYSENREYAVHTAKEWATFLNVPPPEPCHCLMCKAHEKKR